MPEKTLETDGLESLVFEICNTKFVIPILQIQKKANESTLPIDQYAREVEIIEYKNDRNALKNQCKVWNLPIEEDGGWKSWPAVGSPINLIAIKLKRGRSLPRSP